MSVIILKMKKSKKMAIITGCSFLGLAALATGALAIFSAEKKVDAQDVKFGSVDIKDVTISFEKSADTSTQVPTDNIIDAFGNLTNLNPGDSIPFSFTVENDGTKSVQEGTFVYIVFDNKLDGATPAQGTNYFDDAANYGPYSNFIESIQVLDEDGLTYEVTEGAYTDPVTKVTYRALRIKSNLETLSGVNVENGAEPELEVDVYGDPIPTSHTHKFTINFALNANVHTMGQSLSVRTHTEVLQYRNTASSDLRDMLNASEEGIFEEKDFPPKSNN